MNLTRIEKSKLKGKKWTALFDNPKKIVHFGASGYEDYTIHKDDERKKRYLDRHRKNEIWTKPDNPGSLSRWILWNKKTIEESIKDFRKNMSVISFKSYQP